MSTTMSRTKKTRIEKSLNRLLSIAKRSGEAEEIAAAEAFEQAVDETGKRLRRKVKVA